MEVIHHDGTAYRCVPYGDAANNEIVVYAIDEGTNFRDIVIPSTLDYYDGTYTIVGLVSSGDINGKDGLSDYSYKDGRPQYRLGYNGYVTGITIPATVRFIGKGAFNEWKRLASITFAADSQLESIEAGAFANCTNLQGSDGTTTLTIPSSVTTFGESAFSNCPKIQNVVFPAGASISPNALMYGNDALASIVNAPSALSFDDGYDNGKADNLVSVSYSPGIDGIEDLDDAPNVTSITLPEGIKSIGGSAFSGLSSLASIKFPSSLIFIGDYAFYGDRSLSSIQSFPGNVQYVGDEAFKGCTSLAIDVTHPGALTTQYQDSAVASITFAASGTCSEALLGIEEYARYHEGLTFDNSSAIGSGSTGSGFFTSEMSAGSFDGCTNLRAINVVGGSKDTVWSEDGVLYSKEYHNTWYGRSDSDDADVAHVLVKYPAAKSGGRLDVPETVGAIADRAFTDCSFDDIYLPVTVKWLLCEFTNSQNNDTPWTDMASEPTIHYVPNSYVDSQLNDRYFYDEKKNFTWDSGGYDGPKETMDGPEVEIVYSWDGGNPNPDSPTSVVGGQSVTIPPYTHDRLEFRGWWRCKPEGGFKYIRESVLTSALDELVTRSVKIEPGWYWLMGHATVTGEGECRGTATTTFTITKAANPMKAKKAKVAVKLAKVKKKAQTLATNVKFAAKSPTGATYANASSGKVKKRKVNKATGKLTVPKGTKKGTYKVKIKVTAKANANYVTPKAQTVTFKVVVK